MSMSDEEWEGRVLLGFLPSDAPGATDANWGLAFLHPDLAYIGVNRNPENGSLEGSLDVRAGRGRSFFIPK